MFVLLLLLILIIVGGGGGRDRERIGWCNVWGVAESSIEWGTCVFQETRRKGEVKKG
jgi:hypothetical protein